ncbi:PulJ/GspJ family protein [Nitrospira moscoviensis]|uniref:Type IV pilus assembly protein PilW n=1 Tax=Nitrospira moscoviensis TaxID=42253 RepID=A0A0K2GJM4_NITMO|nr:hypothetical protein [Nitrospira moscoviensis]ALA60827.1 hypothetical protein NITMOv2_4453 [Nitrospira moscoviensis]
MTTQDIIPARITDARGFCLTELLVSLTAGAIVLAATWDTFTMLNAHANRQYRAVAGQQELRLGLEVFEQEARLAAAESLVNIASDELSFSANVSGLHTTTTSVVLVGQSTLPVQDGRGWGAGKSVTVCGAQRCELHRLARTGQRSQLSLVEPLGLTMPAGASVEVTNRVSYYSKREEDGTLRLMRMVDGGASTLIEDLRAMEFSYWDKRGHAAQSPSEVSRVIIAIILPRSTTKVIREVSLRS